MRLRLISIIAIAAALCLAAAARATTMLPLDLKALVERADRVVLATVESQRSEWTPAHDAIYTDVVLRVERSYKGPLKPGETVVVRREGGSVDGIGMRVYGAAGFTPGEEVLVFLEQRGPASWVVGMAQGKLHVEVSAGQKIVRANLRGIALTAPGPTALRGPRPLADVERDIRAEVRAHERVSP